MKSIRVAARSKAEFTVTITAPKNLPGAVTNTISYKFGQNSNSNPYYNYNFVSCEHPTQDKSRSRADTSQ